MLLRYRRASDSIARTGGEEFTILLPGSTEHEAYLVGERMRAAVEREFVGDPAALTFSFGIATYPDHGRTADSVLEAADQALYAAKALGRNRCVIFNAEISAIFAPEAGRGADEVQLATLVSLAEALDLRDTGTSDHSWTVGRYCGLIAAELGLPPERVKRIETAGVLLGKIGLPDATSGSLALPDQEIPLEAKILAVADAYEAMTADPVYRPGIDERAARAELLRCSGDQFDSRVIAAFLAVLNRADASSSVRSVEIA